MTENQIKEQISLNLLSLIAAQIGISTIEPRLDEGTDLLLKTTEISKFQNRARHFDSGLYLALQVKSTTKKWVKEKNGFLHYNLESKNYDDLIRRKNRRKNGNWGSPLILILLVLEEDQEELIEIDFSKPMIGVRGTLYWFHPLADDNFTENTQTQVIKIPLKNRVELKTFKTLFKLFL